MTQFDPSRSALAQAGPRRSGAPGRILSSRVILGVGALSAAVLTAWSFAAAPADAAFPGANGKIACEALRKPDLVIPSPNPTFISRTEIIGLNGESGGEFPLTNNMVRDGDPSFSPDGKKVAFESRRVPGQGDNSEIYVANNDGDLEGPDVKRLTFNNGELAAGGRNSVASTDRSPSWSPDGSQIVFHSGRETTFTDGGTSPARDFEIYKMSATTGEPGGLTRLTTSRGQDAIPHWSPDGSKIAFQSTRELTAARNQNVEVFTMNPDGTGQTNVSKSPGSTPDNSNGLDRDASFSPDGKQIVFTSSRSSSEPGNSNYEIYKMNRDGSLQTRLTSNLSGDTPDPLPYRDYDLGPSYSPDGKRVLFTSGRESTPDGDTFVVFSMDSAIGESAGLKRQVETDVQFGKCDWQSLARPAVAPPITNPPPTGPLATFPGCPASSINVIRGGSGNSSITGTVAGDRIFAGTGNDIVDALAGNDCVDLGPGDDRGQGGSGNDLILGGLGRDRISGSSGNDSIRGNAGADNLNGGTGNDRVFGDAGNDVIFGSFGNDVLHGVSGNDKISGSRGRDKINGGSGRDTISAGSSNDRVAGDQGSDRINGNSGDDVLKGNSGNDRVTGGSGADGISGGSGNDSISARDGRRDRISCGSGRDTVTADRIDRVARDCERVIRR